MEALLTWLTHLPPEIIHSIGYGILFLATICEGIPPLGLIIPGQNLVIAGGFFANIGLFSTPIAFIYICIGAWIGDLFAYSIGKKYGTGFLKKYGKYIKVTDDILGYVEKILHKNLMWGSILSKFYGWTRGIFPFMAGTLKISFSKILLSTGISNFLWGTGFFLLGYLLGESYGVVAQYLGAFITRGIVAGIAIAILFRYFKSEYHIFKPGFSLLIIGDILSIILFSLITQRIYGNKLSFVHLDTRIQNNIIDSPVIDQIMLWIDQIFGFWSIGLIGLIIIVYLHRKKLMYYLTVFVSSMLSILLVFPIIKLLIQRTRPDTALVPLNDFSFPSGHAAVSLVVCLLCRYIIQGQLTTKRMRHTLLVVMICCALLIGINRIVLDVHRFTDVLGGFLLGFFILTTNILIRKIFFKTHIEQQKVLKKKSKKQLIDVLIVDN